MKKKKAEDNKLKIVLYSIVNPWTIVSIIIILFCTICLIYETFKVKDYEKIEVTYVSDCSKYEICNNHYMYTINNKNYGIKPAFETIEKYKKKNYAYYNSNNPNESIMISKWSYINIFFIIVIIISTISYYKSLNYNKKDN